MVNKKLSIYNGSVLITLYVIPQIVGYKLGEFCITRKKPPHIGKQKHVKKVSRQISRMVSERKYIVTRGKTIRKGKIK